MRRFIVPSEIFDRDPVTIEGELFRHMSRVLRLQAGDSIILCAGPEREHLATIRTTDRHSLTVTIDETVSPPASPQNLQITLIQGLPKGDKFDLIIQKATELGVKEIVAFHAARSVVKISADHEQHRLARWHKIATEAARQSERSSVPAISLAKDLSAVLHGTDQAVRLFLKEREIGGKRLQERLSGLNNPDSVAVLVGPEGGFSQDEASLAIANDFYPVSLGPRILRTETAGITMISILQYLWGDIG